MNKLTSNLLIITISLLVAVLLLEGGVRLVSRLSPPGKRDAPRKSFCRVDDKLGWRGNPGTSVTIDFPFADMRGMHIRINKDGFWDSDHSPATKKILFLGDSFTMGYGIPRKNRFSDLIQEKLPVDYEVVNMGMWGYGTDQELLVLRTLGKKYDPAITVVSIFLNDFFANNLYVVEPGNYLKPKFGLDRDLKFSPLNLPLPDNHGRSRLLNLFLSRYYRLKNRLELGREFNTRGWFSVIDTAYLSAGNYSLSLLLVKEMYDTTIRNRGKILFVLIPYRDFLAYDNKTLAEKTGIPLQRIDRFLPQKVISRYCRERNIPLLDLTPYYLGTENIERFFFQQDLHWTAQGHNLAAELIYERLATMSALE